MSVSNKPSNAENDSHIGAISISAQEEAERLQGERFLQLSQRCHEQNWAQVHALAEQIVLHKRQPPVSNKGGGKIESGATTKKDGDENERSDNSTERPGKVINNDGDNKANIGAGVSSNSESNHPGDASTASAKRNSLVVLPHPPSISSAPRMLSTCLGTASPLAWTCRYSAPSATVKLVLDLDLTAVRRCLPQLGTPLHECVGRPRPLRKLPLKRGRWSSMFRGESDGAAVKDATSDITTPKSLRKKKRKKKKHGRTPRILAGLREWRRTVRTLIQADESLLKEDSKIAAALQAAKQANEENTIKSSPEEWRRTVYSMIRDNVTNINKFKSAAANGNVNNNANARSNGSAESQNSRSSENMQENRSRSDPETPKRRTSRIPSIVRATLSQDADGNTPLHFMIRGAASPAFGGGRWHSRHEVEDDYESDEDGDDGSEGDDNYEENAMDVDSSAGEETASGRPYRQNTRARDLRPVEYGSSSWDGVRWCMEAHLRRVERRMARRMQWKEKMNAEEASYDTEDDYASDGYRGVARRVASVRIGSPQAPPSLSEGDEEMPDDDLKLPAKRKSIGHVDSVVKASRKVPDYPSRNASDSKSVDGHDGKKRLSRKNKYLSADEYQDCCYDPLLGAVRDLVHTCPEAVGIPDHREYEETPLIVALKSSIYVVMEPAAVDNDHFQLVQAQLPGGNNDGGALAGLAVLAQHQQQQQPLGEVAAAVGGGLGAAALGDGIPAIGNAMGGGGGAGGMLNGMVGIGGGAAGIGGGFPFPELGALMHNRPFNFFPDDEAMMAVLRGHGRRVSYNDARRRRRRRSADLQAAVTAGPYGEQKDAAEGGCGGNEEDDDSSVSDDTSFHGDDNDPRYDAFVPSTNEQIFSFGMEPPGVQLGLLPRRRPRYDYQTALEYRIFMLVRIMLDAYPRAACLMISDYTPLHSAVFHGRCPDTIRLLLDAEARFRDEADHEDHHASLKSAPRIPIVNPEPCPTLAGPAMLCTNTRGELPLHFACMRNECARSIRLLAEADPRAALVRDASGRTPLRWLWIRFVDGLLDRFGGRDTQREEEDVNQQELAFQEQEGGNPSRNFPNPGVSVLGGMRPQGREGLSTNPSFIGGEQLMYHESADDTATSSTDAMFVFDTEYIRRTRNIDRTVDFLRMRHVPSGFENIEYVAAEHAITVLLKLKYLQQRRNRQLEAYESARNSGNNNGGRLPPDVPMSTKEEFILYAFEKFTALIYAVLVASSAEERMIVTEDEKEKPNHKSEVVNSDVSDSHKDLPSRKKIWHSLPHEDDSNKNFFLVHEACGSSRASCPAAVAKICIRLFSDQLFQRDDSGRLPLHRVSLRGLGWEPPGSDVDTTQASLADETLTLLKEVLSGSHESASRTYDNNRQLPLHCAVDSLVTSLVMGKRRRASLHAEARVALQKYRHTHVEIAIECLSELLQANSSALQSRDGKTGLYPFMQAAVPHINDCAVVKYTSDLSRRPGFDVGVGFHSMEKDVVEEDELEAECDQITMIYYLLRENPSVISSLL